MRASDFTFLISSDCWQQRNYWYIYSQRSLSCEFVKFCTIIFVLPLGSEKKERNGIKLLDFKLCNEKAYKNYSRIVIVLIKRVFIFLFARNSTPPRDREIIVWNIFFITFSLTVRDRKCNVLEITRRRKKLYKKICIVIHKWIKIALKCYNVYDIFFYANT